MLDSGGARHLRERNHLNSLHIFTLGDMSNPMWYLVLTLYMSSQSWYSCGFFCLLWLVGVSVLSNLVYAGSFHPKPTQDHKVSICIKIMSMRSSCLCTYCLQEGLMSMKVFSLIIFCSDAYGQDTCNTLPTLSWLCSHMPLYFIFTWVHTCRGSLCLLHVLPKLYLLFFISLSKALMYVAINYQKGGDWKHKCSLGGFGN